MSLVTVYPGSGSMNIERAILLGQCVLDAERVVSSGQQYNLPEGYDLLFTFEGNDLVTDIDKSANDDAIIPQLFLPFGYVAISPAVAAIPADIIVIIRGTESIWEWIQDARFDMVSFPSTRVPGAGRTEDGFTDMYSSLSIPNIAGAGRTRLAVEIAASMAANPGANLTVSGHSLGGALATLLSIELAFNGLNPSVYTFASPYVGDPAFVARFNALVPNSWRIANQVDIATHLPPRLLGGYEHVNTVFQMNLSGEVKTSIPCFHALNSYLHALSVLSPTVISVPLDDGCKPGSFLGF